jgi:3'-phosphoadenosine 5'-phosphosulfate synthase
VPIVLPATGYTKAAIEASGKKAVALVDKDGRYLAILRNPEIYENRKEEIVTRCFGVIDMGHPYIAHIYGGGEWLIGGEIELLQKVTYNDGLDQYRLTPKEMYAEFEAKGADVVFAFQTRNPTHAGHAFLMNTGRERLMARGYKNPVLWLSPLGGWTKADDVPLDVRVKQHVAILDEKMLDPAWTVTPR